MWLAEVALSFSLDILETTLLSLDFLEMALLSLDFFFERTKSRDVTG